MVVKDQFAVHSEESRATLRHALRAFGLSDVEVECFTDADIDFLLNHRFTDLESLRWGAHPTVMERGGVRPVLVGYIRRAKERAAAAADSGPAAPAPSATDARREGLMIVIVKDRLAVRSEESRATLRHALKAFGLSDAEVECFTDADIDFLLNHGFTDLESLRWGAHPTLMERGGVRPVLVGYIRRAKERAAAAANSGPAAPAPADTDARDQLLPTGGAAVAAGASQSWWSAWLPSASVRGAQPPEHQLQQQPVSPSSAVGPVAQTTAASHVSPAGHVPDVDCTNVSQQQQRLLSATCRRRRAHSADPGQQKQQGVPS